MYNTILTYVILFLLCFSIPIGICQFQTIGTIQGQVTDNQNNPLSDYTITAVSKRDNVTYAAKTNSGGQFTLKSLAAGTWVVKVRYLSTLLAQREVTISEETEVTANFVIEGTGVVSGFLLDSISELPLPITDGIQIGLLTQDEKRVDRIYNGEVSNGYFEAKNLLPGRYRIIDSFDGYVFAIMRNALGAFRPPMMTVYPDSHVGGVKVFLKPGASLSGRFIDAENRQPISGVTVRAASEVKDTVYPDRTFAHQTETNTKGEFRLTIPNDSETYYAFTVIAIHPRYQTHRWRWDMPPEQNTYDLGELSLKTFLSLQGKVAASNSGYNVDGLRIQLKMHNKPVDFFRAGAQPEHIVRSDEDGKFVFSRLHPIEYSLTISQNDELIAILESVNPQSKKPINIRLPKMKTLHGTVVDAKQNPMADTQIYASRRSETQHGHGGLLAVTQTDANGTFQMQLLDTKPHLLSMEVSKNGYLSKVYRNVEIKQDPLVFSLQEGFTIKGRVILPRDVPPDGHYVVKVFPANINMKPTLNPLVLNKPIMLRSFPTTEQTFVLDGLLKEKYALYISGDNIATSTLEVKASASGEEVLIIADRPTVGLKGQVFWADTEEPVRNALVSRSWYPWELTPYDLSLTLDRFKTKTDAQGNFAFSNMTQERYQLHIRAVQSVFEKETETYQRIHIQKQIAIQIGTDNVYNIYLGKQDGTAFTGGKN